MAIKTQGTSLYALDPEDGTVLEVGCITSLDGISSPKDQVEVTCLQDNARSYVAGLETPGTATFTIYTDTSDDSHVRLHELYKLGENMRFAVGWSDGTEAPTAATDDFTLPDTRSWITFEGYLSDYPFSFATNSVVSSDISVQISGEVSMIAKVPATEGA